MLLFSMDSIIELNFTVTLLYIRKTWEDPFASKVWGGEGVGSWMVNFKKWGNPCNWGMILKWGLVGL